MPDSNNHREQSTLCRPDIARQYLPLSARAESVLHIILPIISFDLCSVLVSYMIRTAQRYVLFFVITNFL